MPWSGEAIIVMWYIDRGILCRHNFYHVPYNPRAVDHAQEWEYVRGYVTWLEYRHAV